MASSSGGKKRDPDWLSLPREVTLSILSRLGAIDVLMSAQNVCSSWFEICKDPLVWRTIDMRNLSGDLHLAQRFDLVKMCRCAVDRSRGQLLEVVLDQDVASDQLLNYISDRSRRIKRIQIRSCFSLSDEGLIDAFSKFPFLEELDVALCAFSVIPLVAVGNYCPRLKSLKLNCHICSASTLDSEGEEEADEDDAAIAIGRSMPALHHLQLIGNPMTNLGLKAILDGCPHLESLDLRQCLNVNLKGVLGERCGEQIKHLRLPYDLASDYDFLSDDDSDSDSDDDADNESLPQDDPSRSSGEE